MSNIFLANGKPKKIVAGNHKDWLALRKGIGSSDVATIMGCNKWNTPYQLWLDKTGRVQKGEENFLMRMGHKLEPVIAGLWSEETGKRIIPGTEEEYVYVHPEFDFLRVSPDREFGLDKPDGILECKSTQMEVSADDLPPYWFCQVQYQMGISQIEYSNIAWLRQGREFGYAEVIFNPDFFSYMVDEVKKFWNDHVLADVPPECSNVQDISLRYQHSEDKCFEAGESLLITYTKLKEIRKTKAELEEKEFVLKEQLQIAMQDSDRLTYNGETLCTWKSSKDGLKFDEKKFKADYPDLYKQYLAFKKGNRPFLIK